MPTIYCKTCKQAVFGRTDYFVERALERHIDICPAVLRGGPMANESWEEFRKRKEMFAVEWRVKNITKR